MTAPPDALPISDDELRAAFDAGRDAADTTGLGLSYTQAMDHLDLAGLRAVAAAALAVRAVAADMMLTLRCPRPCNTRPDDWPMAACVAAGECGCDESERCEFYAPPAPEREGDTR